MFKLVKWAFKLGQQTERHRIAGILNESRQAPMARDVAPFPYDKQLTEDDKKRREYVRRQVNSEINNIVDLITMPQPHEYDRYSILHPKDGK